MKRSRHNRARQQERAHKARKEPNRRRARLDALKRHTKTRIKHRLPRLVHDIETSPTQFLAAVAAAGTLGPYLIRKAVSK